MPSLIQTNIKRTFQINMHHVYRLQFEGFGTRDNFLSGIQQFFCISSSGCSCTNEWKHQSWLLLHIQYNQYSRKTREWYMANTVSSPIYVIQILTCCFYYIHVFEFRKLVFHVKKKLQILYPNYIRTTYFWCSNVLRRHLYWNDQIMMS